MSRGLRYLLSFSSGVLLSLPWLGFPGWIIFVAFLPLLWVRNHLLQNAEANASSHFFIHSYVTFIVWNGLTTWWIINATLVGAILAIVVNAFLMSVVTWLAYNIHAYSNKRVGNLALVLLWLTFEFFHFHWDIEWPWLTLGNALANHPQMVQWYSFTGVLGGSLWIWSLNILIVNFLVRKDASSLSGKRFVLPAMAVVLFFLPVVYSNVVYYRYSETLAPRKVLIVQPNIDPYSEAFDAGAHNNKLQKFLDLTHTALTSDVDYIIGPETVFEQQWEEDKLFYYPSFAALQQLTLQEGNPSLIIGASTHKIYYTPESRTATSRLSRDGTMAFDAYNTAIFVDSTGNYQLYHKSILVSGVEKMPFRKYLRWLDRLIINLGGTTGTLGTQPYPTNFETPLGDKLAPVICYESVFGGYVARYVRDGADLLVIITNDGWWKNTPGYKQHFAFARLRAIEARRTVVRSANTGISGVINQRGDIVHMTEWWVDDSITAEVNLNKVLTFYVRNGDYIGRLSMFASALLLLNLIAMVLRKKNPHQF